ncbi:amino acid adenylation domain-containing protein [Pseudomonadota bacterium AL_CKDN230030165-1A_HGKHYDSX7]
MTTLPRPVVGAASNFVEHLEQLARDRADEVWLVVAGDAEDRSRETQHTYGQFAERVLAMAAALQQMAAPGERALVMLENDDHYAVSMLACFHAGVIAVPVFPPESTRPQHLARLVGIATDAGASVVICLRTVAQGVRESGAFGAARLLEADAVDVRLAGAWRRHVPAATDVAFLQYTSGSTSAPKGVMVSHGNLMANERAIEERMAIGPDDKFVCWSPLYHDMGLIGGLLQPLHRGIGLVLTSPRYFLERPTRWLELISRHRGTISGGPDFAYRLCLERAKDSQLAGLDLSSWRVAYTGAEPVRSDTMAAFAQRFAPAGFDPAAVYACFGLAEATLMATGGHRGAGMRARGFAAGALEQGEAVHDVQGRSLVACGIAPAQHSVRIADPAQGGALGDGRVGEIWFSGPSVATGYWNNPQASAQAFVMHEGRRWLRTGDLGFVDQGELYVTGRIKDLIILRGHNLYPQDIEQAVEQAVPAVRKGRVAAFLVDGPDGEAVGVAAEISRGVRKDWPAGRLARAIAEAVSEAISAPPAVVVLLNPGALPKTSSGKLQRQACRQGWHARTLDAYAAWAHGRFVVGEPGEHGAAADPLDELEAALAACWSEAGIEPPVSADTHFFAAGGSSLTAVRAAGLIEARWDVVFPLAVLFEAPRLRECAARLREILATPRAPRGPVLRPGLAGAGMRHPLSAAQERLWFLQALQPDSTAYHVAQGLDIQGELDVAALRAGLAMVIGRHESLRTAFVADEQGTPWAEVMHAGAVHVDTLVTVVPDAMDATARERAQAQLAALNLQPFDLGRAPLVRLGVARLGPQAWRIVLVLHHLVADAHSVGVVLDELGTAYAQGAGEGAPRAADCLGVAPRLQYRDYVCWQQQAFDAARRADQIAYWRRRLGNDHPVLSLPADAPRLAVAGYAPAAREQEIPAALVAQLRARAARHDATLPMILLAALHVLLHRYTGLREVRVGMPVAGRQSGTDALVGMFVNTVVIDATIEGRTSLAEVLGAVRAAAIGAQAHQDLPFDALVQELNPPRSLMHTPLFQVLYNHLQEDLRPFEARTGLRATPVAVPAATAQFELTVETREDASGALGLRLIHADSLFSAPTIARLAGHYLALLEAFASGAATSVRDVVLPGTAERDTLSRLSEGEARAQAARLVPQRIAARAAALGDATALVFEEVSLSYRELNARANRLAHALIAQGVRPESMVGVALPRSVELVVSLLAVMKAGAAYIPIDPELPAERVAYMLEDSRVARLITTTEVRGRLMLSDAVQLVELDATDVSDQPVSEPEVTVHPEHLAYVIYTSGSTGRPKGAANRHGALANRLDWMQAAYGLGTDDVVLQKTPFGFDVSVWEFFWPLIEGATLALAAPGAHREPRRLAETIRAHGVTTLHFVPSMLQAFLAEGAGQGCDTVRRVICSGEALPAQAQADLWGQLPRAQLFNLYGPTEAAIDVTHWTCVDDGQTQVPIGRPIWNTTCRVLDADLNEAPLGVPGELYLGGAGLARGYLHRPGLSAERFVADPSHAGGRLYRTGDLVRWRADGALEYLGRLDHQVKIRGLRIELGEIEAVLLKQPDVMQAVVVADAVAAGPRLVAYVAPAEVDVSLLKTALARSLPDYMVPALFQALPALPLNANGKIDRKALPSIRVEAAHGAAAPQGPVETALARIWADILGVAQVGRDDDFFELGGHSLLATRIVAAVRTALARDMQLEQVFAHPRLANLAAWLAAAPPRPGRMTSVPVGTARRGVLSYAQQRLWFLWKLAPEGSAMNIPAAFLLHGECDGAALQRALQGLADRHDALRTVFGEDDGRPWQEVREIGSPAPAWQPLQAQADPASWQAAARGLAAKPFDLLDGPLWRVGVARIDARTSLMVVVMHHIIADGWSSKILLRDFLALYDGSSADASGADEQGAAASRPRYLDYAAAHRDWLDQGEARRQADAWRERLTGVAPLALPADLAVPAQRRYPLAVASFRLGESHARDVAARARQARATPYMLLLAATAFALAERSGQPRFYLGTDVANRETPGTQDMVGFFVNQLALPFDCADVPHSAALLAQVRGTVLDAASRQDLPFDRLVAALGSQTRGGRAPLFQVKVIHQDGLPRIPGAALEVEPLAVHGDEAELDLIVSYLAGANGIEAVLLYDAERFSKRSMDSLAAEIEAVILALAAPGNVPLAALRDAARQARDQARQETEGAREAQLGALRDGLKRRRARSQTGEAA